jgi:FkbM family methyltransferase
MTAETPFRRSLQKVKFAVYNALDTSGGRFVLASLAAGYATVRTGRLCSVSYDGAWIQKFPTGTIVEPRLTLYTLDEVEGSSRDFWMYAYEPAKGDTVVDVGAGTGWDTLAFSRKVGPGGRVIAIEAHPKTFACLERMCKENRLRNVTLIHAALMDRVCDVHISDAVDHLGNRTVAINEGVSVPGVTLDGICKAFALPRIDLLKMNIEGAEKYAVEGMTEALRAIRHVCISCHDFAAAELGCPELRTKSQIVSFLRERNFVLQSREKDPRASVRDFVYASNASRAVDTHSVISPTVFASSAARSG